VGFDGNALERLPMIKASAGVHAGMGCAVRLTRATVEGGPAAEYGLVSPGDLVADGLRVSAHRRCALGLGSATIGATATLTDTAVQGVARCDASGLEAMRLPLSAD